jgi:arginyl-tRNA synthetase
MNFKRLKRAPTSIFASSSTAPTAIAQLGDLTVPEWLAQQVQTAMGSAFGEEYATKDAMVTAATKAAKGSDYQCNAALPLAKLLGLKSPRDAATALLAELNLEGVCDEPSIAGPGFINLKLSDAFVEASLEAMRADPTRLGVPEAPTKQKVVVDFSSPNIAKEMHVGHLRSTIIGDTLSRVLEFRGHNVVSLPI